MLATVERTDPSDDIWRALANPVRRQLLDELGRGPRTTGELAAALPELSRFAVMQHLEVLVDAELVLVRRRGRERFNHLNAVPLQRWYERWVVPLAQETASELLSLERTVTQPVPLKEGDREMSVASPVVDQFRTVRIENELRFRDTPQRVFDVLVKRSREWFPATYGEHRVVEIVLEPRVGGAFYEDWGSGRGHLYGTVTAYDPPAQLATRGRLAPGTILDTEYRLVADGDDTILRVSKVAVGPISADEAAGIQRFGDMNNFAEALRRVIEGA
jgi:DNA-binding transcriptional ArsR family regulator